MFMRMLIFFAALVGVTLGLNGFSRSNGAQGTKPEGGIKLQASVIKEHFQVGEPILLKLVLKNESGSELRLVSTGLKDYKLDVRNEQGKLRPLTPVGEALKRNESFSISKGRIAIGPGDEREEGEISVTDRFKLTEPGKYVIIVRRPGPQTDGKPTTMESNKVTVVIR